MLQMRLASLQETVPCTRCGGHVELTIDVDLGDGVHLELCTRCDPGGGLSGEFLAMLTSGLMPADRFVKVSMEWMYEALAAQGWYQVPREPS